MLFHLATATSAAGHSRLWTHYDMIVNCLVQHPRRLASGGDRLALPEKFLLFLTPEYQCRRLSPYSLSSQTPVTVTVAK